MWVNFCYNHNMTETIMFDVSNIIKKLNIKRGDVVADLGTGREGRMALAAAKYVGDEGLVYAVDIVKAILPSIQTKAAIYGLHNIKTVWSDLEVFGATKAISDNSLDVAFLVTILFQSKKHDDIIKETVRMLKPGGRLAIVDWKTGHEAPIGPAKHMRVNPKIIIDMVSQFGLKLVEEFDAGRLHWGLIFIK